MVVGVFFNGFLSVVVCDFFEIDVVDVVECFIYGLIFFVRWL